MKQGPAQTFSQGNPGDNGSEKVKREVKKEREGGRGREKREMEASPVP